MKRVSPLRRGLPLRRLAIAALAAVTLAAGPGHAYESASTHAGLTGRAALASRLHAVLSARLGLPLGLFEPLRLSPEHLEGIDVRRLREQLGRLDPAEGYRPDARLTMSALMWLEAGSVLEEMPAERGRHHFLDPQRLAGLDNRRFGHSLGTRVLAAMEEGGTFGGIFTGLNFDFSGEFEPDVDG